MLPTSHYTAAAAKSMLKEEKEHTHEMISRKYVRKREEI